MSHVFRDTAKGDSRDWRARLQELAVQLEDRKRVNTLLNTENQRLKSTVRDLEGRLVLSESSSGARDAVGECAALRAFKNTISNYKAADTAKTAQLAEAQASNAALQQQLEELQHAYARLQADLESVHATMSAASSSLSATVYRLEGEQRALQQALVDSQAAASNLEAQKRMLEAAFEEQGQAMQRLQQQLLVDGQQQLVLAREAAKQEQAAAVAAVQGVVSLRDAELLRVQDQLVTATSELAGARACIQAALQCGHPPEGWSVMQGQSTLADAVHTCAPAASACASTEAATATDPAVVMVHSSSAVGNAAAEVHGVAEQCCIRTTSVDRMVSATPGPQNTLNVLLHDLAVSPGMLGLSKEELWPMLSVHVPYALHCYSIAECALGQAAPVQQLLCCQLQLQPRSLQWLRSTQATVELLNARACIIGAFKHQMPDGRPQELAALCVTLQTAASTVMLCTLTASGAPGTVVAMMVDASSCMQTQQPQAADSSIPPSSSSSSHLNATDAAPGSTAGETGAGEPSAKPAMPAGVLVAAATLERTIYGAARLSGLFEETRESVNLAGQQCAVWRLRPHSQRRAATKQNIGRDIHVAEDPMLGATAAPLATGAIALAAAISNLSSEELGRPMLQQFLDAAPPTTHSTTPAKAWEAAEGNGTATLQLLSSRSAPAAQLRATVRLQHSVAAMVPLVERLQTLEAEAHITAVALAEAAASAAAAAAAAATAAASGATARCPATARAAAAASSRLRASREPSQRLSCGDDLAEEDVQPLGSVHLLGRKSPGAMQHGTGCKTQGRYTQEPAGGGMADSMVGAAGAYDDGASTDSEDCEEGVVFAADPVNLQTIVYGEDDGPEPEDSFLLAAAASLPQPLQ